MRANAFWVATALAAATPILGCRGEQDEFAPAVQPKTVAFTGRYDPTLVGDWFSLDGKSYIDLLKDGTVKIQTTSYSYGGKTVTHVAGKWLMNAKSLLIAYVDSKSGRQIVLKYGSELTSRQLTLTLGRIKTIYRSK